MKWIWSAGTVCLACVLAAQETTSRHTTYTYDLSGNRVEAASSRTLMGAGKTSQTQKIETVNGRSVPIESVEEKVLSETPEGRVVERIVRRYDQNGQPGPTEKTRIEARKSADGTSIVQSVVYRGDLNGRFELWERSTTHTTQSGDTQTSQTLIERSNLSGSLEVAEKRVAVETKGEKRSESDVTTYRRSDGGRFYEAAREITERRTEDQKQMETTTQYNAASTGKLEFAGRTVSNLSKTPDGAETRVVEVYGAAEPGRAVSGEARLREQQLIERRKSPEGLVVETFSVRRPSLADPEKLGRYQKISETVCTGRCDADGGNP